MRIKETAGSSKAEPRIDNAEAGHDSTVALSMTARNDDEAERQAARVAELATADPQATRLHASHLVGMNY